MKKSHMGRDQNVKDPKLLALTENEKSERYTPFMELELIPVECRVLGVYDREIDHDTRELSPLTQ